MRAGKAVVGKETGTQSTDLLDKMAALEIYKCRQF